VRRSDIAVLVRRRYEARAIRLALSARRVRSVYLSDDESVYQSEQAADLVFWLQACLHPEDERSLKAALATATLSMQLSELESLQQDELLWEQTVLQFREYRSCWAQQGVLPMLHRLIHDFKLPQRLMNQPMHGERGLTNLLHLAEVLQQAASELDGQAALIQFLQLARTDPNRAEQE